MFVLQRTDGAFVAPPGLPSSYTRNLQDARTFPTREAAERDRCPGNETIVPVANLLRSPR